MDYLSAVKARDERFASGRESEVLRLSDEEVAGITAAEAAAAAAANAVVIPEDAQLALNRQGYQAFQMVGKGDCV